MRQPLKILHILPRLQVGGVETMTVALTQGLMQQGHQVWVMSGGGDLVKIIKECGATHVTYPAGRKAPWCWALCAYRIWKLMKQEGIQVLHPHSRVPGWSAWVASRFLKVALTPTFHAFHGHKTRLKRAYNQVMTWGDRVFVSTHFIKEHIQKVYSTPQERVRVVSEGIDMDHFQPIHGPEALRGLRKRYGIPEEAFCMLLPARLTSWKGHQVALRALHLVRDIPRIMLCLMGEPTHPHSYTQELLNTIDDLQLKDHVIWVPTQTDMRELYALSDLVLNVSQIPEAFGRVVAEAQAMERNVIVSHPGGASEVIQEGVTGWLFPRGNVAALAQRIRMYHELSLSDRRLCQERARQWVLKHFSVRQMVDQTVHVYREALCLKS